MMWGEFMNARKIVGLVWWFFLGLWVVACSGSDLGNPNKCPKTNEEWNSKKNKCMLKATENILVDEESGDKKAVVAKRPITPAPIDVEFLSYSHQESAFTLAVDVAEFAAALGTKAAYEGVALKFLGGWQVLKKDIDSKKHRLVKTEAKLSDSATPVVIGCAAVPKAPREIGFTLAVKENKLELKFDDDVVVDKAEKQRLLDALHVDDEKYDYLQVNENFHPASGEDPPGKKFKAGDMVKLTVADNWWEWRNPKAGRNSSNSASRKCFKYIYEKQDPTYTAPDQLPGALKTARDALTVSADPARLEIYVGGKKLSRDLKGGGLKYFLSALDEDVAELIKEGADRDAFEEVVDLFLKEVTKVAKYCKDRIECTSIPS